MAQLTFTTPNGNDCYGCMALDNRSYYCEFFKEFLYNEHGGAGCMKCDKCKELGTYGCAKQEKWRQSK